MSFNEKKKAKSKIPGGSLKKSQPRIEAIQVTVERKKKCNEKALQIVTDFSEGTISEDKLLDNLKYITQEHYQDIVEERAINKLCGYPLCSEILKNIPSKQYHISTTLNKVYDITDRKNFCSNLCYKASKYLKDQVLTSPLWLRDDDSTTFTLMSLQSKGGMTGDEVDLGINHVKLDLDNLLSPPPSEQNNDSHSEEASNKVDTVKSNKDYIDDGKNGAVAQFTENGNETRCLCYENHVCENLSPCKNDFEYLKAQGSNEETIIQSKDFVSESFICETSAQSSSSVKPTDDHNCNSCDVTRKQKSLNISNPITFKGENSPINALLPDNISETQNSSTKSHKHSSKRKSLNPKNKNNPANTNPVQNVVLKIEQILKDWVTVDSLCFILGEEKIKEILAERKNQDLPAFTQDVQIFERYMAICKKLNLLEIEDTKIDASYRDEIRKPLPNYEALKEEARQMEIKVKMFYRGDKVQFEGLDPSKEAEITSEAVDIEPVVPLVDMHAQKALRRRIVIDKLKKVLQDLQTSLGLRGFNLTEDVRTLVSTLTLSAHNITMKPAEWNLVAIAIIKLLSLRDNLLAQALNSSIVNKHLTLLLMSYSLDSGYLDRLMVWLTDVEAVVKKT